LRHTSLRSLVQDILPLSSEKQTISFNRLMIGQDTGSAIVGPARADIFWGAGDGGAHLAGRIRHPGTFAMLVPRELALSQRGRECPSRRKSRRPLRTPA